MKVSFKVVGEGEFPHAAMAADRCWPADMHSSELIEAKSFRRIELEGQNHPIIEHWNRAGWIVLD